MRKLLLALPLGLLTLTAGNTPQKSRAVMPRALLSPASAAWKVALSTQTPGSVVNGWGPVEIDRSNGEEVAGDGSVLTLNGKTVERGFGTHAPSSLTLSLVSQEARCTRFTAEVGVDDEVGHRGSVQFQVYADGEQVYASGAMTGASETRRVDLDITGKTELRLVVTDAGNGASYDHADWANPTLTGCAIPYSPPLVITRGGIYSGNWESTTAQPAVTIKTSEPVVIEKSRLRGGGPLIQGFGVDLTVRDVQGESLTPQAAGQAASMAIKAEEVRNLRVENNAFTGGGVYVRQFRGDPSKGQGIRILRNRLRNIDGRVSDGAGGYSGSVIRQAVQLNDVTRAPSVEVAWNEVINEPGESAVEDNINLYVSSGTPDSPILIHDNYIQGGYPVDPTSGPYSGGGILLGDGRATDPAKNGYAHAYENQVVSTTNYGVAIIGGVHHRLTNNRVISSGLTGDGERLGAQNVGWYVWDMYKAAGLSPATFGTNRAEGNVSGWTKVAEDGKTTNNPAWGVHCSLLGSACTGNRDLGTVTLAMERQEYARWQEKLAAASIHIGPR